jgi:hypothetical protein
MRRLRAFVLRLAGLFDRGRREREFEEELASNLALHIEENVGKGLNPEEARRRALIQLGGIEMTKELYRERRGLPFLETLAQDVRFGVRMLWKSRGFTLVAVLVMALGIGANTAVFSVVNAVLLRPLAFNDPDHLVILASLWQRSGNHGQVSSADFHDWHDQNSAFESMAYYNGWDVPVASGNAAEYVLATHVTSEFFHVFRVQPIAGREFAPEESKPGGTGAVIVSNSYASSHFGGSANAIGHTLRLPLSRSHRRLVSRQQLRSGNTIPLRAQLPGGGAAQNRRQPGTGANTDDRDRYAPFGKISRQQRREERRGDSRPRRDG